VARDEQQNLTDIMIRAGQYALRASDKNTWLISCGYSRLREHWSYLDAFVITPVRSHGTALLSPEGYSWPFIFRTSTKIFRENSNLVKTGQKDRHFI